MAEQARLDDRLGDQHREVGEVLGDQRVVDRDLLAVEPARARVVPGQGSAPAGAGEGERDLGKGGIGRILVDDAQAIPSSKAGRGSESVALAAAKVTVPMLEPFFWTSSTVAAVAAILAYPIRAAESRQEVHGPRQDLVEVLWERLARGMGNGLPSWAGQTPRDRRRWIGHLVALARQYLLV